MIPTTGALFSVPLETGTPPTRTFCLRLGTSAPAGMVDGREALEQAVRLIFGTERYRYPIYGREYGIELGDLAGRPADYVQSELRRRVTQALTADDRITAVEDFAFTVAGKKITCVCTARTIYGDVRADLEVRI